MKLFFKFIFTLVGVLFLSCNQEIEKPKVIYPEEKNETSEPIKRDSSQIKIADLPIQMEGTRYLIHAVGDVRVADEKGIYGSSKTNSVSYAISNYNRFEITGYLENLKFQHVDSLAMRSLTNKVMQIQTVTYLATLTEQIKKQVLVYSLVDSDTNRDGKIDANDIKSLYVSLLNGTGFTKLTSNLQELLDWNVVEIQKRLYFRTLEDINKNGAFDKNDKVHYYYVNLNHKNWEVKEYQPI